MKARKVDLDEKGIFGIPRELAVRINQDKEAHIWEGNNYHVGIILECVGNGFYRFYKKNGTGEIRGEMELSCCDLTHLVVYDLESIRQGRSGF